VTTDYQGRQALLQSSQQGSQRRLLGRFGSNLERYFAVHRTISVRIGNRSAPFTVREYTRLLRSDELRSTLRIPWAISFCRRVARMFVAIPSPKFINSLKQQDFLTNMFRTIRRDQRSPRRSAAISRVSSRFRVAFPFSLLPAFDRRGPTSRLHRAPMLQPRIHAPSSVSLRSSRLRQDRLPEVKGHMRIPV
jgi:hypothetical protein